MARPRKLGGPEGGIAVKGKISSLRSPMVEGEDASVTIRIGPKAEQGAEGEVTGFPRTVRMDVPTETLKELKLDQTVEIRLVPMNPNKGTRQVRV